MKPVVAAIGLLLAVVVWRSVSWPLIGDAPLYHYVAWLISEGLVPYRDIFDFNMPGVYLIHRAVLWVGGPGDLAWRIFDLGWLTAIMWLLYAFCRPLGGRWGAAGLALVFGLYHLADGAWMAGQRDFLLSGLYLIGLLGVVRFGEADGALKPLVLSGLAAGVAMVIKPFSGLFWLGCATLALLVARRRDRSAWAAGAVVLAAGLVVPVLVFGWLAAVGGLGAFLDLLVGYLLPFYGKMGAGPLAIWRDVGVHVFGWQVFTFLGFLALLGLTAEVPQDLALRRWCGLLGVVYGALHFTLQRKGWTYHLYPLVSFLLVVASPAFGEDRSGGSLREDLRALGRLLLPSQRAFLSTRQVARLLLAMVAGLLAVGGGMNLAGREIEPAVRRVDALTADLARLVPPGEEVQAMDDTHAGGIHALLRRRLRQPAPFIYDFPLFHDDQDPRIQRIRERFLEAVLSAPPAALVVSEITANRTSYDRIDELPELARLLEERYRLEVEGDGYRLYLRR